MRKKILIVYDAMITGGTTTAIIPLMKIISKYYDVDLLLNRNNGECMDLIPKEINVLPEARIKKENITLLHKIQMLILAIKSAIRYIYLTKSINYFEIKKNIFNNISLNILSRNIDKKYDVAIGFIEGWADNFVSLNIKAEKKIVWIHAQMDYVISKPSLENVWMKNIDKFIFVTEANKIKFDIMFPKLSQRSTVCENLVNKDYIISKSFIIPNDKKYKSFIKFTNLKIITVCRLTENIKGIDRIVNCVKILKYYGLSFKWFILGDGKDRISIEKKIKQNGIEDNLLLLGNITNPFPYVRMADIFVLLSRFEGKPISITEALILGTPPIVTNYPSAKEQIIHNENGIIINNNNEDIELFFVKLAKGEFDYFHLRDNLKKHPINIKDSINNIMKVIEE